MASRRVELVVVLVVVLAVAWVQWAAIDAVAGMPGAVCLVDYRLRVVVVERRRPARVRVGRVAFVGGGGFVVGEYGEGSQ